MASFSCEIALDASYCFVNLPSVSWPSGKTSHVPQKRAFLVLLGHFLLVKSSYGPFVSFGCGWGGCMLFDPVEITKLRCADWSSLTINNQLH